MRRLLILTFVVFAIAPAAAQAADTCTSTGDGNWLSNSTWANCSGGVPTSDDTVEINGDHIYLVSDVPAPIEIEALTLNYGGLSVHTDEFLVGDYQQYGGVLGLNGVTDIVSAQIDGADSLVQLGDSANLTAITTLTNGARLSGFGTVNGELRNESGVVSPGDGASTGQLTFGHDSVFGAEEGVYGQSTHGVLELTINGTSPGQFDQIAVVNGGAVIGGTLAVNRAPGLTTTGRSLPILTTSNSGTTQSLESTFATVTGLGDLKISYSSTDAILTGPELTDPRPPAQLVPQPASAATSVIPAKPTITLPSSARCRQSVRVKISPPAGTTIASSSVKAGSKKVKTNTATGIVSAKIKLKKRTKISVTTRTSAGATQKASKTYKLCI